jgi:hypothetical protein
MGRRRRGAMIKFGIHRAPGVPALRPFCASTGPPCLLCRAIDGDHDAISVVVGVELAKREPNEPPSSRRYPGAVTGHKVMSSVRFRPSGLDSVTSPRAKA